MIGKTLGLYIAWRFAKTTLAMMIGLYFLIVTVDFVEQLRRAAELDVSMASLYAISLTKAPVFLEKAFPFGCLFAAMVTLTQLNNKMELVVARSAGVSAWQFLLPISAMAVLIGLFAAFVYNPASIRSQQLSDDISASVFGGKSQRNTANIRGYWIREDNENGATIIHARLARKGGTLLDDARIIQFDKDGRIERRIDAENAVYSDDSWILLRTKTTTGDSRVVLNDTLAIKTNLSESALLGATAAPETIPFWQLRKTSRIVAESGGNAGPYLVQFYGLTALPVFLVAMILIAATVSLRFVRFGQVGRMILGGILSGFVLYTVTSLVTSLGSNGIVPPAVASWSPAIVAILFGISILLYQEDG